MARNIILSYSTINRCGTRRQSNQRRFLIHRRTIRSFLLSSPTLLTLGSTLFPAKAQRRKEKPKLLLCAFSPLRETSSLKIMISKQTDFEIELAGMDSGIAEQIGR